MAVSGLALSQGLEYWRTRLGQIDSVKCVGRNNPTIEEVSQGSMPAIYFRYEGSTWTSPMTRYYTRVGVISVSLFTSAGSYHEAEDALILLTDQFKAWLRANEKAGDAFYRSVIVSDSAFSQVDSRRIHKADIQVQVEWKESFQSEVGVLTQVGGA